MSPSASLLEQNNFICSVDCNREIAVSDASSASDFNFSKFSFNARVTSEDETKEASVESSFCAVVDFLFVVDFLLPPLVVVFFVVPFSPSSIIEEEEEESIEEEEAEDARIREIGLLIFFPIIFVRWRITESIEEEDEHDDDTIFIDNNDDAIIERERKATTTTR
jgi:hypothetical protein